MGHIIHLLDFLPTINHTLSPPSHPERLFSAVCSGSGSFPSSVSQDSTAGWATARSPELAPLSKMQGKASLCSRTAALRTWVGV